MSTPPQGQNPYTPGQGYGQQPPPPQGGYGYPPQPGQPGMPPQQGQPGMPLQPSPYINQGAPAPMPPQRPKRSVKTYLRIAGFVIIICVAVGSWWASRDDADTASVGDCMSIGNPGNTTDPDLEVVDCSDSKARYKVVERKDGVGGGCDRTKYSEYRETGGGDSFTLCLTDHKP